MTHTVKCFCGATVQTEDEETLITLVSEHASGVHDLDLSRDDILAMANSVED
ncbi:MAG: hypothetical protein RLZZ01_2729 [Actinomycetota bacterium]|jgi:predicted small metal-binding protein